MTLAKMMEKEERKKAAVRLRTYSVAEQFSIVELMALRLIRQEPSLNCLGIQGRIRKLVDDAKLNVEYVALNHLDDIFFSLARAGHLDDIEWSENPDDQYSKSYNEHDTPTVSKKGRAYMLGMPKTVQNAATRIMQPYTVLDRIAAAIPKIPKAPKKRRRRRRS